MNIESLFEYLLKLLGIERRFTPEGIRKHIELTKIMSELPEEERLNILAIVKLLQRQKDGNTNDADEKSLGCYKDLVQYLKSDV